MSSDGPSAFADIVHRHPAVDGGRCFRGNHPDVTWCNSQQSGLLLDLSPARVARSAGGPQGVRGRKLAPGTSAWPSESPRQTATKRPCERASVGDTKRDNSKARAPVRSLVESHAITTDMQTHDMSLNWMMRSPY